MRSEAVKENVLLILLSCLVSPLLMAAIETCSVKHNPDLDHKTSMSWLFLDLAMRNSSRSRLACATSCLQNPSCVTFMVDTNRTKCRMYGAKISRYSQLLDSPGSLSYDTCRANLVHGQICNTINDCAMPYSVCVYNTCQCDYGWSYSPNDLACVKECDEYGSEFTYFTETYLTVTTSALLTDSRYYSFDGCSSACVDNTQFVCRAFFLNNMDKSCTLLNTTPSEDQIPILGGLMPMQVDFYQRQCQYIN